MIKMPLTNPKFSQIVAHITALKGVGHSHFGKCRKLRGVQGNKQKLVYLGAFSLFQMPVMMATDIVNSPL